MGRIAAAIQSRQNNKQKVFVAYITAGDPSLAETDQLLDTLGKAGVDIVELGVPFSDPLADGPVNQKSAERALSQGTSLIKILEQVASFRKRNQSLPIVLFTYLNPIYRLGYERFAELAQSAGVDGVLVVDLPPEEANDYRQQLLNRSIDPIFLASPTSSSSRLQQVNALSRGFVYYVSRTGVTGVQAQLSDSLLSEMAEVKARINLPVMIGFGISNGAQAQAAARLGDGIVIGSALVRLLEDAPGAEERQARIAEFALAIRRALDSI